jgi:hypothetical protein
MNAVAKRIVPLLVAFPVLASLHAADIKVDLSKEQVGKTPVTFEPMVGTWVVTAARGLRARTAPRSS